MKIEKGDINQVSLEELAELPLMNTQRAHMVIDYRDRNGNFSLSEKDKHGNTKPVTLHTQLLRITGINERMAARVEEHYEVKASKTKTVHVQPSQVGTRNKETDKA